MKLKALIFDVDGTLADTEEAHRNAFNESFRRHGLDWNWSKPRYAHLLSTAGGKERLAAHIDSLPLGPAERQALSGAHRRHPRHQDRHLRLDGRGRSGDACATELRH